MDAFRQSANKCDIHYVCVTVFNRLVDSNNCSFYVFHGPFTVLLHSSETWQKTVNNNVNFYSTSIMALLHYFVHKAHTC